MVKDIKGKTFGRLFVVELASDFMKEKRLQSTSDRAAYWKCNCECGKETITRTYALTSGATKSCGCYMIDALSERASKEFGVSNINSIYKNYKQAAKRKQLSFSLSRDEFIKLILAPCHYCGTKHSLISNHKNLKGNRIINHNGIDRVLNTSGYDLNNCVTCCTFCNYAKRTKSYDEFIKWIDNLVSFKRGFTMKYNVLFDTDSYKASHWLQYPPATTSMFSYIESRGGDYPETIFFGLQYYLKEYLSKPIMVEDVEKAKVFFAGHGVPFNYDGWMYIAKDLKGKLPVRIRAVLEGMAVPTHNILVSVESTDPKVFWIVSWIETSLLRTIWYGVNVATRSHTIKKIIRNALEKSSDDPAAEINFKLHNFGSRGVSSQESAIVGDMAHLVNFMGTDTVVGVLGAAEYYNCPMAGFSIPASEHSSITSWGDGNEVEAYRNMIKQFAKPGALVACVSDSYDLWNAITNLWGTELKNEIIESGATLIVRPDSGNPPEVVLQSLKLLDEKFGSTINTKGYKVLNHVRIIQGDGINEHSIQTILDKALDDGFSATNIAFGMGGALMQQHNRDTQKFAMKCSSVMVDGKEVDVYKNPKTDTGKSSKRGRLDLIRVDGRLTTVKLAEGQGIHPKSEMITVYEDGECFLDDTFDDVRSRADET